MKKNLMKFTSLMVAGILCSSVFFIGCQDKKEQGQEDLTPVTLSEVAHSIFYAPQYAAYELGYFKEEGIDLTIENAFGADKVMTALVSGNADIGFAGSESSIYVYAEGQEDYAVNFAQLTQRAGNFLVSRTDDTDFKWEDLKGQTVLGGRAGDRRGSAAFLHCLLPLFYHDLHLSDTFSIHLNHRDL